jgi:tRNA A37 N6-isopentenylltransferase MiaA
MGTLEQAVAGTVAATVAYARRQRTWFRKEAAATRVSAPPHVDEITSAVASSGVWPE